MTWKEDFDNLFGNLGTFHGTELDKLEISAQLMLSAKAFIESQLEKLIDEIPDTTERSDMIISNVVLKQHLREKWLDKQKPPTV